MRIAYAAHLLVEQCGHAAVEHGVVGDDLLGGVLARLRRPGDRLVDGLAQGGELRVDAVDIAAEGGAVVERAGQLLAQRVHPVAGAVGLLAQLALLSELRRVDRGRAVEDVGGEAAFGIEIARDVANGADDREPALGFGDPLDCLVLRHGDVDGEAAAHGRERDDGGGQERTDFHDSVRQLARGNYFARTIGRRC
ncbi:hypothetical protein ACVW0I_003826 [Bradyrhizobium sp. LM6.11]